LTIKLYQISFRVKAVLGESGEVLKIGEELTEEELESSSDLDAIFYVGAEDLPDAFTESSMILDEKSGNYEIISVVEMTDVNIANWPDEEECDCVWCRTERAAEEDLITIKCKCGDEIRVIDEGWESFDCPKCGNKIFRNNIIGSNGRYILVNLGEK
jgi:predicted RNA-binding Zn-ribbon protein involved in translation (DUF1610 family)